MAIPLIGVIGSLNTDLITITHRIPVAGETLISQSFDTGSGGKGANQAVACARLSRARGSATRNVNVRMQGAVGDDLFGKDLMQELKCNGIDTENVAVKQGEQTGVAVILVEEASGENRILMSPNANFSLKPVDFAMLGAPVPDLIVLQLEIPLDTTLHILETARQQKIEVLMNPAPAQCLPKVAYSAITHLIVNESEAAIITAAGEDKIEWTQWGPHTENLIGLGVQHVVITLGSRGALYLDTSEKKAVLIDAEKVKAKDTTAAGDTFVGAYAVSIVKARGKIDFRGMSSVVRWANKAAARTVERDGAQAAIPWLDELPEPDMDHPENFFTLANWKQQGFL